MSDRLPAVVVFAPGAELGGRVLGGSVEPWAPERREALDWLTLCRFLGWQARIERDEFAPALDEDLRCAILAGPPEAVDEERAAAIEARLAASPALFVAPPAPPGSPLARLAGVSAGEGRRATGEPRWVAEGRRAWNGRLDVEARSVDLAAGAEVWAFAGGAPLVVGRVIGRGAVATLTVHPSRLRDASPSGSGVVRRLLTQCTPGPPAPLDLERTVILRMDDPGAAINVHLKSWRHTELSEEQWRAVAAELASRDARMSVCYVPGWIDDGDAERGELSVAGESVERVPGGVHPSPLVRYVRDGEVSDYEAEARALSAFRDAGAGDIEQHGYTHVRRPEAWAAAPDRYDSVSWFRELEGFGDDGGIEGPDPIVAGRAILAEHLGADPVAFTCPGQACTDAAAELALDAGFDLVAADALAIRDGERLLWSHHVPGAGIDYPVDWLFEAGLPVVASLHDRDIALNGPEWLGRRLDEWTTAGARRFIDFRELAAMLGDG